MWGFPPLAEEFVKRWTITRNRSGNYHYQTPTGRRFTSRDAVRDLLADMQKTGKFETGWILLGKYIAKACMVLRIVGTGLGLNFCCSVLYSFFLVGLVNAGASFWLGW